MRRVWIALAALVGFVLAFGLAVVLGFEATNRAECDGPCFDMWEEALYIAVGVGVVGAVIGGVAAHQLIPRRFANRNAKPS